MDITAIWNDMTRTLTLMATLGDWAAAVEISESDGLASLPRHLDELRAKLAEASQKVA